MLPKRSNCPTSTSFLLSCLVLALLLASYAPISQAEPIIPGKYIVILKEGTHHPSTIAEEMSKNLGFSLEFIFGHALRGYAASIPDHILEQIKKDPRVKYIEPDRLVYAFGQTTPTGVSRIGAVQNSIAMIDGYDEEIDVDIAILDSGIDLDHPDLNVVEGVSFVPFFKSANDYYGHGTHVAGIAAARDNDFGVVGVAPGARLHAVKVLSTLGLGGLSSIIAGIDWVTEHADEIEVVNMSIGSTGYSQAMRDAIANSVNKGVVYVVAAGNEATDVYGRDKRFGTFDDVIPACFPEVATVSALVDLDGQAGGHGGSTTVKEQNFTDDTLAGFTNFSTKAVSDNPVTSPGAAIDFAAPGLNILSTYRKGGYYTASGTSMSSPYAAGCVALYIAKYGRAYDAAGVAAIRQALIHLCEPQTAWGPTKTNDSDSHREGLLNAQAIDPLGPSANLLTLKIKTENLSVPKGGFLQLTAQGNYENGAEKDLSLSVTWASADESVVTIDPTGLAKGVAEGVTEVTASLKDLTSEPVTISVTEPIVEKIEAILGEFSKSE